MNYTIDITNIPNVILLLNTIFDMFNSKYNTLFKYS